MKQKLLLLFTMLFFLLACIPMVLFSQVENTPTDETSDVETPTDETSDGETPTDETSNGETPADETSEEVSNPTNTPPAIQSPATQSKTTTQTIPSNAPANARVETFPIQNVETLLLQGNIIVHLTVGNNESLSIAYTNELVEKFSVEQKKTNLTITTKESLMGTVLPNETNTLPPLYVTISIKTIHSLTLKGHVALTFARSQTVLKDPLIIRVSGKSSIEGKAFAAPKTVFSIGSNTTLSFGILVVDDLTIKGANRNTIEIPSLKTTHSSIILSGKGNSFTAKKFLYQYATLDIQGSLNNIGIEQFVKNPNPETEETGKKTTDTETDEDTEEKNKEPSYTFALNVKSKKNNIIIDTLTGKDMFWKLAGKNTLNIKSITIDTLTATIKGENTLSINTLNIRDFSSIDMFGSNALTLTKTIAKKSFSLTQEGHNIVRIDTLQGREAIIMLTGKNENSFNKVNTTFMTMSVSKENTLSFEKMRAKDTFKMTLDGKNTITTPYLRGKHINIDVQGRNNTTTIGRLLANNTITINNTAGNIMHIEEVKTRDLFMKNEYLLDIKDIFLTYLSLKSKTKDARVSIETGSIGRSEIILFENAIYNAPKVLSSLVSINTKHHSQAMVLVDTKLIMKAENNSIINYDKFEGSTIENNSSPTGRVVEGTTLQRKKKQSTETRTQAPTPQG